MYENFMVLNPDKCYFLTLGFQNAQPKFSYDNVTIKNVFKAGILPTNIDKNLTLKVIKKIFVRKLIKNSMRLLELRLSHGTFK